MLYIIIFNSCPVSVCRPDPQHADKVLFGVTLTLTLQVPGPCCFKRPLNAKYGPKNSIAIHGIGDCQNSGNSYKIVNLKCCVV